MEYSKIRSTREHVSTQLLAYGEERASRLVLNLNDEAFEFIEVKAMKFACEPGEKKSGAGMLLDKALCLAAIFVLEGASRPLSRTRRRYS
jgi:hypothetical protein